MKGVLKVLFSKRDNTEYINALTKLKEIKTLLQLGKPKIIKFKEVYITEIKF